MGSVYWGLPGIMKLDPTGQELWVEEAKQGEPQIQDRGREV